jgi:hypothetical protein
MSKLKNTKKKLQSKIDAIKKINDNPVEFTEEVADKYLKNIPSTDEFIGKKLSALQDKISKKKENTKDIFSDILEVVESFMENNKKSKSKSTSNSSKNTGLNQVKNRTKRKLKQHAMSSADHTMNSVKEVVVKRMSEALFMGEGICGTESTFVTDSLTLTPQEFDFLDMLTVDPDSSCGQIIYESKTSSTSKEKVNRNLYGTFSGGTYTYTSNNNNNLFTTSWDQGNQRFNISGLTQGSSTVRVQDFISDYYSSLDIPDIQEVAKTAMLLTIQGGGRCGTSKKFDLAINNVDRLLKKLMSVCGSKGSKDLLKNQTPVDMFDESEEDIERYFDFDDVEGIDLDDEDARYRRVLRFKDCYNFEIDVDDNHIEDFIYLTKNKDIKDAINDTLNMVATDASEQSDLSISLSDLLNNLLNNFILSLPKALIMTVLSAKFFLPIVILYKAFKQTVITTVTDIKVLMKKMYKAIYNIINDLYWIFIREFWRLVKIDLIAFVSTLVQKIIKNKYKRYLLIITSLIALLKKVLETDIDNCYEIFQTILSTITGALSMKTPINVPSVLLYLSEMLPGYSQDRAYLNIMEKLEASGIPTGPLFGESNDLGSLVKSIIDGHSEEEDANSYVKIVLQGGVLPGPTGGAVIPPALISGVGKKF